MNKLVWVILGTAMIATLIFSPAISTFGAVCAGITIGISFCGLTIT